MNGSNGETEKKRDTAMLVASEIREADERADKQADKAAERQERSHREAMAALKDAHALALAGEEKRARTYALLFALSLLINLALVAGLLKLNMSVNKGGVVIESTPTPATTALPSTP